MANILVIDDDKIDQTLIKRILEKDHHIVFLADNGAEGEKIFRENNCDLVIVDIFLPIQDGLTTIRKLKKDFPKLCIIAVSSGGVLVDGKNYLKYAKDFGASHALQKPIETVTLLGLINNLLGA